MGCKVPDYLGAWYHATKFSVEGFSDCLRMELAPFGSNVVIIKSGGITPPSGISIIEVLLNYRMC